jgi:hypothetical protein
MSLADAFERPAAFMISESGTVLNLGKMPRRNSSVS